MPSPPRTRKMCCAGGGPLLRASACQSPACVPPGSPSSPAAGEQSSVRWRAAWVAVKMSSRPAAFPRSGEWERDSSAQQHNMSGRSRRTPESQLRHDHAHAWQRFGMYSACAAAVNSCLCADHLHAAVTGTRPGTCTGSDSQCCPRCHSAQSKVEHCTICQAAGSGEHHLQEMEHCLQLPTEPGPGGLPGWRCLRR